MRRCRSGGGKLYVLGGGWTHVVGGNPVNMALGIVIAVPWTRTNERLDIHAELLTDDGVPVNIGGQEVAARGQIELGRPAGVKAGSDLNAPLAFSFHGVPLVLAAMSGSCGLRKTSKPAPRSGLWGHKREY